METYTIVSYSERTGDHVIQSKTTDKKLNADLFIYQSHLIETIRNQKMNNEEEEAFKKSLVGKDIQIESLQIYTVIAHGCRLVD